MKTKLLALLTAILSLSILSSCTDTSSSSSSDDDEPRVRRSVGGYRGGGQGGGFGGNFGGF